MSRIFHCTLLLSIIATATPPDPAHAQVRTDAQATVDTALERFDFIDPDRLGVLGGSYGGYMTSWIVSHTNRFTAACSERAVNHLLSIGTVTRSLGIPASPGVPTGVAGDTVVSAYNDVDAAAAAAAGRPRVRRRRDRVRPGRCLTGDRQHPRDRVLDPILHFLKHFYNF